MKNGFAPASPSETIVFGARRPGYNGRSISQDKVAEWIAFMKHQGIGRVCCLLSPGQLTYYEEDLLSAYQVAFGEHNVCYVPVEDYHLIDRADLEHKLLPFLRESEKMGTPVVVHCSGGSGRTGHALAAWLTRERHLPVDQALEIVSVERNPREAVQCGNATEKQLIALLSGTPE